MRVEYLTQVIHETKITSLEEATKAQWWGLFRVRCHMSQTGELREG